MEWFSGTLEITFADNKTATYYQLSFSEACKCAEQLQELRGNIRWAVYTPASCNVLNLPAP